MKKIVILSLLGLFIFSTGVVAGSSGKVIEVFYNLKRVEINNQIVQLKEQPFIYHDTAYVPLRDIVEKLNQKVVWDEGSNSITIKCGDYKSQYKDTKEICITNKHLVLPDDVIALGEAPGGINMPTGIVLLRNSDSIVISEKSGIVLKRPENNENFSFLDGYITGYYGE